MRPGCGPTRSTTAIRGAGAQCRRHADRQLHGRHRRRHRAGRDRSPSPAPTTRPSSPATASGNVTEAGGVANGTPGTADRDRGSERDRRRQSGRRLDRGRHADRERQRLRHLHADGGGVWTYTLDDSNATVQALNVGQTLTDTFTATTVDGTAQLVTITINGANDAAVISGTANRHGDRSWRRRQRHAGHADRDRRSELRPTSTTRRCLDGGRHGDREHQRLRHAHARRSRGVDLHAGQQQCRRCRRSTSAQTLTDSFTVATVDGTSQVVTITITRRQRRRGDQRHRDGERGRSRRCRQRHARHADRDRRPQFDRRRQSGRRLDGGRHADRKRQRLRHLHADSGRSMDLHARQQQCRGAGAQRRAAR